MLNSLLSKLSGVSGLWGKLDGSKTYIGGAIALLQGGAGLLQEVLKLIADKNVLEVWSFLKALPTDQNILVIAGGLVAVGLRHSVAKAADASAVSAPADASK